MKIAITEEKRGEIERIQREFAKQLSPDEILRGTAKAINGVLNRSISRINKGVKNEYNITNKYLKRTARVYPKAASGMLWGGIELNIAPLPLIAFNPKQSGSSISFSIRKGKTSYIRNSFIATVPTKNEDITHTSVFSRGHYDKKFIPGREKTKKGKIRITKIMGTSVFNMGRHREVADDVRAFMGSELSKRVEGILKGRVAKITNGNG